MRILVTLTAEVSECTPWVQVLFLVSQLLHRQGLEKLCELSQRFANWIPSLPRHIMLGMLGLTDFYGTIQSIACHVGAHSRQVSKSIAVEDFRFNLVRDSALVDDAGTLTLCPQNSSALLWY